MIHILFGQSEAAALKYVLKKIKADKEQVITIGENFAVGPIWRIHDNSGFQKELIG